MIEITTREAIDKGWSSDRKYHIMDADGTPYLLRISDPSQYEAKRREFEYMQALECLKLPMCRPIDFGMTDEGVYSIQSWIDGEDAETVLSTLTDTEQYIYGLQAGRCLKTIHSLPAPDDVPDWEMRFNRKIDRKIQMYRDCPLSYENGDLFIQYLQENRHLLANRPQSFQHGDYHVGNMMIDRQGQLQIIDFNRSDFGDPWEEFNRIVWCAQTSPLFASGMVNGYFGGEVPIEFWRLLAVYIASNTLSSLPWAVPFGEDEIRTMTNQAAEILTWYDNMRNVVPSWYHPGFFLQEIDGIPFKMKSAFDFSFLSRYGQAFKVFDDQDSGNICFGMERNGEKYFVKFAGAPTDRAAVSPEIAIENLKSTVPIYEVLAHKNLVRYLFSEEIGGGFAMVFAWTTGDCPGRMYPSGHRRFLSMPAKDRLRVFRDVLDFFSILPESGYVAIDFYDGSILHDFDTHTTTICDIDFFRKTPCVNNRGRMWGSSRFMSPEEYELGAALDEVTNVYTLGACAFALLSDCDRSPSAWPFGDHASYHLAARAVSPDRILRPQSIREFITLWDEAVQDLI